jgi:hypothetical protein
MSPAVAYDLGAIAHGQIPDQLEFFPYFVERIHTLIGAHPDGPMIVVIQTPDEIAPYARAVPGIIIKGLEGITVKPVQSVDGPKPKKAIVILDAAFHGVIGQAVLDLVMIEIIGLPLHPAGQTDSNDHKKQYSGRSAIHKQYKLAPNTVDSTLNERHLIENEKILINSDQSNMNNICNL